MDIRLNAKLSAYSKIPSPKSCNVDTITKEDIDSLFDNTIVPTQPTVDSTPVCSNVITFEDIDSLFRR